MEKFTANEESDAKKPIAFKIRPKETKTIIKKKNILLGAEANLKKSKKTVDIGKDTFYQLTTKRMPIKYFFLKEDYTSCPQFDAYIAVKHKHSSNVMLPVKFDVDNKNWLNFMFLKDPFTYDRCFLNPENEACKHVVCSDVSNCIKTMGAHNFYSSKIYPIYRENEAAESGVNEEVEVMEYDKTDKLKAIVTDSPLMHRFKMPIVIHGDKSVVLYKHLQAGTHVLESNLFCETRYVFSEDDFCFEDENVQLKSVEKSKVTIYVNGHTNHSDLDGGYKIAEFENLKIENGNFENMEVHSITILNFKNSVYPPRQENENFYRSFFKLLGFGYFEVSRHDEITYLMNMMWPNKEIPKEYDIKDYVRKMFPDVYDMYNSSKTFFFMAPVDSDVNLDIFLDVSSKLPLMNIRHHKTKIGKMTLMNGFCLETFPRREPMKEMSPYTPILIKPNGLKGNNFSIIEKEFSKWDIELIRWEIMSKIPEEIFSKFYPNCMDRPYGSEWRNYMFSGPVMIAYVNKHFSVCRTAALAARAESGLPWTKNIIHCPERLEEFYMNRNEFANFFPKIL